MFCGIHWYPVVIFQFLGFSRVIHDSSIRFYSLLLTSYRRVRKVYRGLGKAFVVHKNEDLEGNPLNHSCQVLVRFVRQPHQKIPQFGKKFRYFLAFHRHVIKSHLENEKWFFCVIFAELSCSFTVYINQKIYLMLYIC